MNKKSASDDETNTGKPSISLASSTSSETKKTKKTKKPNKKKSCVCPGYCKFNGGPCTTSPKEQCVECDGYVCGECVMECHTCDIPRCFECMPEHMLEDNPFMCDCCEFDEFDEFGDGLS